MADGGMNLEAQLQLQPAQPGKSAAALGPLHAREQVEDLLQLACWLLPPFRFFSPQWLAPTEGSALGSARGPGLVQGYLLPPDCRVPFEPQDDLS